MKISKFTKWSNDYKEKLPDSAFAVVAKKGDKKKRKLPYKDHNGKVDVPHLRNSLINVSKKSNNLSKFERTKALSVLRRVAKCYIKSNKDTKSSKIMGETISKFEERANQILESIIVKLRSKATNKKPEELVSFEAKKIGALIEDLQTVIDLKPVEEPVAPPVEEPKDPPADGGKPSVESKEDDPKDPPVDDPKDPPVKKDDPVDPSADDPKDPPADESKQSDPENESKFCSEDCKASDLPKYRHISIDEADDGYIVECYRTDQKIIAKDLAELHAAVEKTLMTAISKFGENLEIEGEESKFQELIGVCDGYKEELTKKNNEISKMGETITGLKKDNGDLNGEISKFKQEGYNKLLDTTVEKVSKFKSLTKEQSLRLKQEYLTSKLSDTALEEIGRTTEDEMFSKLSEPKVTTKPSEHLTNEKVKEPISKMSSDDQLDLLADFAAKIGGYVKSN